jgi:hypothetical protein
VLAALGLLPLANLLTGGREVPWWRAGVLLWSAAGGVLLLLLWALLDRWGDPLQRGWSRARARMMGIPAGPFVAGVSLATMAAAGAVALYCYAGRPFSGDEMATTWHARMLLAGRLSIPPSPHPEFFNTVAVMDRGPRWYSQYPVGGPALLALGLLMHAAWLVNPVLLGVATWQLHRFVRRTFGEATARATILLFALTPFVLVLGATQMSHAPVLALTLVALAELAAWDAERDHPPAAHAAALGLAIGAIALFRPFDALLVAIPIGIFQATRLHVGTRRGRTLLVQCAAGAIPVLVLLWANVHTTGDPLLFAYDAANGPSHRPGFHVDPNGEMHSPLRGLIYTSGYLLRFDRFLFEWPLPALLIVCTTLVLLRRGSRWDSLLLGLVASFLIGYAAYWFNGFFDGPRFLLPIVPVLVLYAARLGEAARGRATGTGRRVLVALVPACVAVAWLVPLPFAAVPTRLVSLRDQRTKLKTDVTEQARRAGVTNALVLVRESWRGSLLARLRTLGVQQFEAEHLVDTLDACALQHALDSLDLAPKADSAATRARVVARASMAGRAVMSSAPAAEARTARAAGGPDSPECRAQLAADSAGTMPYAMFLAQQTVGPDGRPGGDVVWARSLGLRDSLLVREYPERRVLRYTPGQSFTDSASFTPVTPR